MADEEVVEEVVEPVVDVETPPETPPEPPETPPEPPPYEAQARSQGWVSQEEWIEQGKDPADWRDAQIFIERGETYRKISNLAKDNKALKKAMSDLAEHHKRVAEFERDKVRKELMREKASAMREENFDRVVEIDEEMRGIDAMKLPEVSVPESDKGESLAVVQAWIGKNKWYESDAGLRSQANILMAGYKATNPEASPEDIFAYASTNIKQMFPQKFKTNQTAASPVASSERTTARKSGGKSYPKLGDLDFEYQKIARNFESLGVMTADKYIKELVDSGAIEWKP